MIGNDIIDLQLALKESNWQRPRFLQKIFTLEEQSFLATAPNKNKAVWLLWSRKESAYKIIARQKQNRFFAPKKLANIFNANNFWATDGQVKFEQFTIFTKSTMTDRYIHTVAQMSDYWKAFAVNSFNLRQQNYTCQHQTTRQQLIAAYAERNNSSATKPTIKKDAWQIPHLYYNNRRQSVMLSIAHHGFFGGYVYQL